jgi:hypothetical protein
MPTNILTFPQGKKAHTKIGEPRANKRKEKKEER